MSNAEQSLRKPDSEGGGRAEKRFARAVIALVVAVATLFSGTITAQAAQEGGNPGYWFNPASDGAGWWVAYHGSGLGPVRYEGDNPVYCIEAGIPVDYAGTWENASDQNSKIAAFMVNQHKGDRSDMTQAAVAYAIHAHMDRGQSHFNQLVAAGLEGADINAVRALADQFWRDARANMPDRIQASYQYTQGKRKGTVNPGILNADGQWVSGIPYTITINGPAVFDATKTNTYSGTTKGQGEHIPWTATGNGNASIAIQYQSINATKLNSPGQDLFKASDPSTQSGSIQFEVINNFQPTVTTEVRSKKLSAGEPVKDRVTSGVVRGDSWVDGTTVTAKGYYFTGAPKTILQTIKQKGTVSKPEVAGDYLKRVEEKLGKPVATAETAFTRANQTNEVTAKNADGTDFVNPEDGMFGGWLWIISYAKQSEETQKYIKKTYIDEFGKAAETSVQPALAAHDSVVLEQYTGMNQDIMDTITIGGFPEDYGTFDGNKDYGFGADAKAKIRVWWAGSGTGDKKEDLKYKPATEEEPTPDEHHKVIGEWEVPAGNGTYKVGGGKITFRPENAGKAQTVAEGVDISATDSSQTGYYVFIYDFPGSDRAGAFKSAYNDPWERSFVEINPSTVDLTSNVSAVEVGQGEEFHDVAHINGQVERGSYVLFTAYDAVPGAPDTGAPKLLDAVRVNVTNEQADNSATKAFDVVSPKTKTNSTGNVYWQAELYNADGEPLASHQLGIESETTIVRGIGLTTKVSAEQAYVGEKFHDTAVIDGKVERGSYVIFDAYGPVDGEYAEGAPKLLDSAKVAIPNDVADKSAWSTSFSIDSPDITTTTPGNVYWQAKVYHADGLLLAQHDLGIAGETVKVLDVAISTKVSAEQAYVGEEFHDTATINGRIESGSYITFDAYGPTDGDYKEGLPKVLDSAKVVIPEDKVADSANGKAITIDSPDVVTNTPGNVYWVATLHRADGTVVATHEPGIVGETVKVIAPTLTTLVSDEEAWLGQKFHDTATLHGSLPDGSYVTFDAYGPVGGDWSADAPKLLDNAKVNLTTEQIKDSRNGKNVLVDSPEISAKQPGNVYWVAALHSAEGDVIASHEPGIAGETVKVNAPDITTQVTKLTAKPGEEFADKAAIDGKVERGSYVTFDAYEPVSGDPDTDAGKLLDSVRVDITDAQADRSDKEKITVTSPKTKTDQSGNVYWKAALHSPDGAVIATHELGLPMETVFIAPGGYLSSQAQVMGAAGTPLYDTVTVYNESDGHEGNGNGNPSGLVGSVPKGSYVTVEAYRQDGHNTASKDNLLGSEDFPVDVDAMQDGQITFKAQSDKFVMNQAGLVYWVATLKTANGAVLDKAVFGESGDQHGTGVESQERTVVQKFESTIGKKTVSVDLDEYAEKTINLYDKVKQTFYEFAEGDVDVLIGQTPKNATIQFEVWEQNGGDDAGQDTLKWTGQQNKLPSLTLPYRQHDGGAVWQNFKSENFTVGKDCNPGIYYVRFRVRVGDEEVYYAPARDKAESFNVVKVTSTATEPIVTTDMAHIEEVLHVEGTLEKGSSYQVELWKTDEQGNTTEKVDETEVVTLGKAVTNSDIKVTMDNHREPGGYQFRFKVWSADNLGGDPTGIDAGSVLLPDDWKQGDGYENKALIYEGANVKSEHFEEIRISTDVTGTTNMHTAKGEHYVDVTNGADINDHATIEGNLDRDGYRIRFELYEKLDGAPEDDRFVLNTPDADLEAGTKELDSALAKLDQPGDYYWVTVFSKADNFTFAPDGQAVIRSDRRIKEESFHAVCITTTTYKWSSVGGKLQDVAHIEGTLPGDSTVGFELHDYATGDKVADAEDSKLSDMDGYEEGSKDMTVTSPEVTVPSAGDHYFVEWVKIPGDDQGEDKEFHRGNDRVDNESTRTIDVNTTTFTEIHLGDTISDQTFLDNISYEKDIRGDYADKELSATWEVWAQGAGDVDTDTLLTTLGAPAEEGAGETEPEDTDVDKAEGGETDKKDVTPLPLENGQTMAESAKWTPAQTGIYYFRVRVTADDGTLVAYGDAREPSETVRVIDSRSDTTQVVEEGKPVKDKVTISGPVLEGTMVSWRVFRQAGTPDADEMVADWSTQTTGAYVITAEDAAKALKDGEVTVESPLAYEDGKAGDTVYFQYSLTAPKRGEDGNPAKPAKGDNGDWTMDHLTTVGILPIDMDTDGNGMVDGDNTEAQTLPTPFHTDLARVESETVRFVKVTTTANTHEATVGDKIHDTAHITGTIPDDTYCVKFEYWEQVDGDDSSKDKLVTTTDCVAVKPGTNVDVDSPEITTGKDGTFYWREHLIRHEGENTEYEVSYGKPRVPDETVKVKAKPLAMTGIAVGGALSAMLLAGLVGGSLALLSGRRRRTLGRHSRTFGRHAA